MSHKWKQLKVNASSPKSEKQQPLHVAAKACKVIQKWYFFINFFFSLSLFTFKNWHFGGKSMRSVSIHHAGWVSTAALLT